MKNLIKLKMLLFNNITFVTYLMKLVNVYSVPHLCGQNKQLVCLFKIQIPVAACSVFYEWLSLTFLFTKHPAEGLFQNQLELCSLEWHVPIPACVWDLGHVIHFPSPAIRPHIPRPGYFSTRDSTPFPECRRFYCFSFLIFFFFSHAAEQTLPAQLPACPGEALHQDWVSVLDLSFIFRHYASLWNVNFSAKLCLWLRAQWVKCPHYSLDSLAEWCSQLGLGILCCRSSNPHPY